jgi:hypothetical protein
MDLQKSGFYVADQSAANYAVTLLSLSSTLNITYLDAVIEKAGKSSDNPAPLISMIKENGVIQFFHDLGYQSVAFATGFSPTEMQQADIFLAQPIMLNSYQNELINMTPFRIPLINVQYEQHRDKINFIFSQLPEIAVNKQPTLTFVHIVAPHPPFVFDADGNAVNPSREFSLSDGSYITSAAGRGVYVTSYTSQLTYINKQVLTVVHEILARSEQPPIIILQGDHGPRSMVDEPGMGISKITESMAILNAYYFPDQDYQQLYPAITPVNSFRVILGQYFDTPYDLLPDKSYFSTIELPYALTDVSELLHPSAK